MEHLNCHAFVGFREIELQNRQALGRVVAASGAKLAAEYRYLSEAELGIESQRPQQLDVRRKGATTEVVLAGRRVATFEGSAGALSPDEARRVRRFFSRVETLHPQVRAALPTDALPALISFERKGVKLGDEQRVVRISNLRRASVAYPLPPGLRAAGPTAAGAEGEPRAQAMARAAAALSGRTSKPSAESLRADLKAALDAGRGLDGLLLLIELSQLHPEFSLQGDPLTARLGVLMQASPDVRLFMEANRLAGDPRATGDREAAARFLATEAMASAPFSSFRYVTYANLLRGAGDTKRWDPAIARSMPKTLVDNYWLHVAAYPWAAAAYKDVGDAYFLDFSPGEAWAAYDLGRAVDPNWAKSPMKTIAAFEAELRSHNPDFF